jgi:hypothetical protein
VANTRWVHPDVIATLVSRAPFARVLLESMGRGQIPRNDLSAYDADKSMPSAIPSSIDC